MGLHLNFCLGPHICWEGASLASLELGRGKGWDHSIHSAVSLTLPHLPLPGTLLPSPNPEATLAHFFRLCLLPPWS